MMRVLYPTLLVLLLSGACNNSKSAETSETDDKQAEDEADPEVAAGEEADEPEKRTIPGKPEIPAPEDVGSVPEGADTSESGLASKVLEEAKNDEQPRSFDQIEMEFVIWSREGKMLDRSAEGEPQKIYVFQAMPGMAELLTTMKVGEKRRAWVSKELAFNRTMGPNEDLTMDVKLLSLERAPEPPPVPKDVSEVPKDAEKTSSGLASKVLEPGKGKKKPEKADRVKVHYAGWTTDGRMFDSSIVRGEPMSFGVGQVIPGWSEGVQLMVEGEKRRLWIPEQLAYRGQPGAPKGMLVFDVELVEIEKAPEPPKTPEDVAEAPKKAERTESGLASIVLKKGTGKKHPGPESKVEVHYSGWTTDGKMFDSSVTRGKPITFGLNAVIPGWTEGVQLMVEGEKRRMWIPEELAYKGRPGAPQGMLVFDVELLRILE